MLVARVDWTAFGGGFARIPKEAHDEELGTGRENRRNPCFRSSTLNSSDDSRPAHSGPEQGKSLRRRFTSHRHGPCYQLSAPRLARAVPTHSSQGAFVAGHGALLTRTLWISVE